jgi:hypothetical protein
MIDFDFDDLEDTEQTVREEIREQLEAETAR